MFRITALVFLGKFCSPTRKRYIEDELMKFKSLILILLFTGISMAYDLTISRNDNPISLEEWKQTVSVIENAELVTEATQGVNPATGEVISIPHRDGDVKVEINDEWINCIFFYNGRAIFKYVDGIEDSSNPVHQVVSSLARQLNATITGEELEVYSW